MRKIETLIVLLAVYNGIKGREVLFKEEFVIKFSEQKFLSFQINTTEKTLTKRKTNLDLHILF